MDHLENGWSVDGICRRHPYLRPSEAHSAMAYDVDHQDEIGREIAAEIDRVESEREQCTRSSIY